MTDDTDDAETVSSTTETERAPSTTWRGSGPAEASVGRCGRDRRKGSGSHTSPGIAFHNDGLVLLVPNDPKSHLSAPSHFLAKLAIQSLTPSKKPLKLLLKAGQQNDFGGILGEVNIQGAHDALYFRL